MRCANQPTVALLGTGEELQDVKRELQGMLKLTKDRLRGGEDVPQTVLDDMQSGERRKADIEAALAEVPEQKIELHPSALTRYWYIVDELWSNIRRSEDAVPGREVSFRHGRSYVRQGSRKTAAKAAIAREQDQAEARKGPRDALRALVDRIVITPDGPATDKRGGGPVAVTVHGQLAALLADDEHSNNVRRVALVAGAGFEPATFRL